MLDYWESDIGFIQTFGTADALGPVCPGKCPVTTFGCKIDAGRAFVQ